MYYCTFLYLFYYLKTNKKFEKKKRNSKKISKARLLLNLILVWSDIVKWYLSHSFRGNCRNLLSWKSYLFFHGVKMVEGRRGSVCTVIFCNPFATLVTAVSALSLSHICFCSFNTNVFSFIHQFDSVHTVKKIKWCCSQVPTNYSRKRPCKFTEFNLLNVY